MIIEFNHFFGVFFFCKSIFPGNRILQRSTRVKLKYIPKTLSVIYSAYLFWTFYPSHLGFLKQNDSKMYLFWCSHLQNRLNMNLDFTLHIFFFHLSCAWDSWQKVVTRFGKRPSLYYVSTFLDLFWPTNPLYVQHK